MTTMTCSGFVLAAPVDPALREVWNIHVYPADTGEKKPIATAVTSVPASDIRRHLDEAVEHLGWQSRGAVDLGDGKDFYAWDVCPLPLPVVPAWADTDDGAAGWDDRDPLTGERLVTHRRVIGQAGGVVVSVARTDRARAGVVTLGAIRVSVSEVAEGLGPDEADDLCAFVLDAARLAIELGEDQATGPQMVPAA